MSQRYHLEQADACNRDLLALP